MAQPPLRLALDAVEKAYDDLGAGDAVAAKMRPFLILVEQRRRQPDWGGKPSLASFQLHRTKDATRLDDANEVKPLRVAAFDAMTRLLDLWPRPTKAQRQQQRRQDPLYREIEEDLRNASNLRKRARSMEDEIETIVASTGRPNPLVDLPPLPTPPTLRQLVAPPHLHPVSAVGFGYGPWRRPRPRARVHAAQLPPTQARVSALACIPRSSLPADADRSAVRLWLLLHPPAHWPPPAAPACPPTSLLPWHVPLQMARVPRLAPQMARVPRLAPQVRCRTRSGSRPRTCRMI